MSPISLRSQDTRNVLCSCTCVEHRSALTIASVCHDDTKFRKHIRPYLEVVNYLLKMLAEDQKIAKNGVVSSPYM